MNTNICPMCFETSAEIDICTKCGFKIKDYSPSSYYLPLMTKISNRYIIGAVIGEGGFGITYSAYDETMGCRCAVKEYFPRAISGRSTYDEERTVIFSHEGKQQDYDSGLSRFENEARQLAKFDSIRSIVSVKDYVSQNGTGYIVMNYVEGISLKRYIDSMGGKISPEDALSLLEPVITALAEMQKNGIIHRDISPDNIMITNDGRAVLIDFGSAREYDTDKSLSVILKHGYAPPEQYSSRGKQGPWTDVYSLCATVYKMITGNIPDEAVERIENGGKLTSPSEIGIKMDRTAEKALMKGLEIDIERRIQSAEELYNEMYLAPRLGGTNKIKKKTVAAVSCAALAAIIIGAALILPDKGGDDISVTYGETETTVTETEPEAESTEAETRSDVTETAETKTEMIVTETETTVTADPNLLNSGELDGGIVWELTKDGVLTFDGMGKISAEGTYPWQDYKFDIHSAVVSDGITEIGENAFLNMTKLSEVVLPSTLNIIGKNAFTGCVGLTEIEIPDNTESIGESAFEKTGLTSVKIPDSVYSVGQCAFRDCIELKSAVLSSKMTVIEKSMFENCEKLSEINISNGIEKIETCAFQQTGLTSVKIPDSVYSVEEYAFRYCSGLKSAVLSSKMTVIEKGLFEDCGNLTSVDLGNGINTISENAFWSCGLTEITLPSSVRKIEKSAFAYNYDMEKMYVKCIDVELAKDSQYSESDFFGSSNRCVFEGSEKSSIIKWADENNRLTIYTDNTKYKLSGSTVYMYCSDPKIMSNLMIAADIDTVIIDDCVTNLPSVFFDSRRDVIKKVVLGKNITSIANYTFSHQEQLEEVVFNGDVTYIGWDAFSECSMLSRVTLPDSLTELGQSAFYRCRSLTSINIPSGVKEIGKYTFEGCSNLKYVTIENGVKSIGEDAFRGCPIETLRIPATVDYISVSAFIVYSNEYSWESEHKLIEYTDDLQNKSYSSIDFKNFVLYCSKNSEAEETFKYIRRNYLSGDESLKIRVSYI